MTDRPGPIPPEFSQTAIDLHQKSRGLVGQPVSERGWVRTTPMSRDEAMLMHSTHDMVAVYASVALEELVGHQNVEGLKSYLAGRMIEGVSLENIEIDLVFAWGGQLIVFIQGEVADVI